mmetsp:Transcript_8350/g.14019  ORF Transcript_8350/g.14019 Transcript_8350/m.14019 type:complete len:88 (+) Transcript_8350:172-435(+)
MLQLPRSYAIGEKASEDDVIMGRLSTASGSYGPSAGYLARSSASGMKPPPRSNSRQLQKPPLLVEHRGRKPNSAANRSSFHGDEGSP